LAHYCVSRMMTASLKALTALAAILVFAQAARAELPYLDNRSDAASLIESLYNAINRKEFARAYSYFSNPPADSFDAYVKGYDGTRSVDLAIGTVLAEGAAGSTYYTVPVAIRSQGPDGKEQLFAGCYTVRAINATIQDPPFRALQIEKGSLKPSESLAIDAAVPDCGAGQGPVESATAEEATALYLAEFGRSCGLSAGVRGGSTPPDVYEISYKYDEKSEGKPDSKASLFRFPCNMGAYNETHVYYLKAPIDPLQPVAFVKPVLDITYDDPDSTKLRTMAVKGFDSAFEVVNSDFNPADNTITTFSKWRGIGDASSVGFYRFSESRFILWNYDVDPTYDGEMNERAVLKDGKVQ